MQSNTSGKKYRSAGALEGRFSQGQPSRKQSKLKGTDWAVCNGRPCCIVGHWFSASAFLFTHHLKGEVLVVCQRVFPLPEVRKVVIKISTCWDQLKHHKFLGNKLAQLQLAKFGRKAAELGELEALRRPRCEIQTTRIQLLC